MIFNFHRHLKILKRGIRLDEMVQNGAKTLKMKIISINLLEDD